MTDDRDALSRLLRRIKTRGELAGSVAREARPKRRRAIEPAPKLEDERVEPVSTHSSLPDNVVEFPRRPAAVEAWLSPNERRVLTGREWISQKSRRVRSITEDLEGKQF